MLSIPPKTSWVEPAKHNGGGVFEKSFLDPHL